MNRTDIAATIVKTDNGIIVEWPDENDGGEAFTHREVFEEHEGDGEWAEVEAWARMLRRLVEICAGPIGSKHDKRRLKIMVEEKEEER